MSIDKIIEFAGIAPESDKNTTDLDLSRGFPSRLHPARQWFNYLFNTVTKKINEIIDEKLDVDANAVSASKLETQRTVSFSGAATGSFNFDGSQNESATLTLANSGVSANTYGGAFKIPVVTVNAKGLVTGVSTQDIQNASTTQKGVVQIGSGLAINSNGILSNQGFGVGQTWKNLSSSRSSGTTYTNTTSKTIFLSINMQFSTPSASEQFLINGSVVMLIRDGADEYTNIQLPIPPGASYKLTGGTIAMWWEFTDI